MSTNDPAAGGSPSEYLLRLAWKRLWKKGTPYYLPTVIAEGVSKDGHDVPPLSPVPVQNIGPLDIVDAPVIGTLSVEMTDNQLKGLQNIEDGGFTYDDTNQTFSAALKADGALEFSGNYQIYSSSKATACAINAAHTVLGGGGAGAGGSGAGGANADVDENDDANGNSDPSDLDVARDYRTRLLQSENGQTLVGTYYDNNEAMSIMFESSEAPAHNWRAMWTQYKHNGDSTTQDLIDQTSLACRNPDDDNHTVGGFEFSDHSFTLQTAMLTNALQMKSSGKYEGDPRFTKLTRDIACFKCAATIHNQEQTAGSVMQTVKTDPKNVRQQVERGDCQTETSKEHEERVQAFYDSLETATVGAAASDPGYKTEARGTFGDTFHFDEIRISGTVRPHGDSIGVNITSIMLSGGSLTVKLGPPAGGSSSAYDKVAEAIGNAKFVSDLIVKKASDKMDGPDVRDYLSNRINQSVKKIFGDA